MARAEKDDAREERIDMEVVVDIQSRKCGHACRNLSKPMRRAISEPNWTILCIQKQEAHGDLVYVFTKPWSDGTTSLILSS